MCYGHAVELYLENTTQTIEKKYRSGFNTSATCKSWTEHWATCEFGSFELKKKNLDPDPLGRAAVSIKVPS